MQDILFIRGTNATRVLDLLAVAAEVNQVLGNDAQLDVAVPAVYADYAELSQVVRRVIPITAPETSPWEALAAGPESANDGSNKAAAWGGKMLSIAKKISQTAGKDMKVYWKLLEELRVTKYDVVFDFDFSPFSVAINRAAKKDKVIGFDAQLIENIFPGAALTANETYLINGMMSHSSRLRHLVARHFDYHAATEEQPLDWCLKPAASTLQTPPSPYIVVGGDIPESFMALIEQEQYPLIRVEEPPQQSPDDLLALVQSAHMVIGNGVATALAAASDGKNLFIGNQQDAPSRAVCVGTPAALTEALHSSATLLEDVQIPDAPEPAAEDSAAAETTEAAPATIKLKKT